MFVLQTQMHAGVLTITISGHLDDRDALLLCDRIYSAVGLHAPRALFVDQTGLQGRPGIGTVYFATRTHLNHVPRIPVGILDLPVNSDGADFHELTSQNAGINLRHFLDRAEALAWLREKIVD
jgi:hypothetical protein